MTNDQCKYFISMDLKIASATQTLMLIQRGFVQSQTQSDRGPDIYVLIFGVEIIL
jgi:hypothetical protein